MPTMRYLTTALCVALTLGAPLLLCVPANAQSALAVQTADLGKTHSDQTFSYTGRAPGADLRGCSLTYEELSGVGRA